MRKIFLTKNSRDGIYYVIYTGTDGKRKRKSLKTRDREKAEELFSHYNKPKDLDYFETQPDNSNKESNSITLKNFATKILTYVQSNFTYNTYLLYKTSLIYLIDFLGADIFISQITTADIDSFKNECLKTLAPPTVNIHLRNVSASFNLALKWKLLLNNPAKDVTRLKELQREKNIFEQEELNKLIETIDKPAIRILVMFGYYTGGRLSELLNLQWNDIDLKRNVITIRNKETFKTKTGKIRKIPISNKLRFVIKNMQFTSSEDYLFKTSKEKPYSKDYAGEIVRRAIRKAGLPQQLHFHCLRHTFITELLRKGVNIYYVSKLAGHSNISTTMGYIHTDTEDYRTAINLL